MLKIYFFVCYIFTMMNIMINTQIIDINMFDELPKRHRSDERSVANLGTNGTLPQVYYMYSLRKSRKPMRILKPYTIPKPPRLIGNCRGMEGTLNKMKSDIMCQPRPTLVTIVPDPGYIYFPDVVLVNRCSGRCGHKSLSCMWKSRNNTKVLVQRMKIERGSDSPCWELEIEVHTECRCGCNVMPQDCSEPEMYNADDCVCDCEEQPCYPKNLKYWDSEHCRCQCIKEEQSCDKSKDLTWIPRDCACKRVNSDLNEGVLV